MSLIEIQRSQQEQLDRIEVEICKCLGGKLKTRKDRLLKEHAIRILLEQHKSFAKELRKSLKDQNDELKQETAQITKEALPLFYQRLKVIKERYHDDPYKMAQHQYVDVPIEPLREQLETRFSGEECLGRVLDLSQLHLDYVNLSGVKAISYSKYLVVYDQLDLLSKEVKQTQAYKSYIAALTSYLEGFIERSQPLFDVYSLRRKVFDALQQFEVEAQPELSIYCEACLKDFANENVFKSHLLGKKHLKASLKGQNVPNEIAKELLNKKHSEVQKAQTEIMLQEKLLKEYSEILEDVRQATIQLIERKQTLTLEELQSLAQDQEELLSEDSFDSEDSDTQGKKQKDGSKEQFYNPLKLPLGWDGKPIPFWLWKLQGLGQQFTCEICGNFVYMGRKLFERHFQEARHTHGMKSLGIPNNKQFRDVVSIQDALSLWKKIQNEHQHQSEPSVLYQEYEDDEGNVMDAKTYQDLKRQGLL